MLMDTDKTPLFLSERHRTVPRIARQVLPIVLGGGYGIDGGSTRLAWAAGISVFFWLPMWRGMRRGLRKVLHTDLREHLTIISGTPSRSRFTASAMLAWTKSSLSTPYVDVWMDLWVKDERCFDPQHMAWVLRQKRSGDVRAYGISTHRRAIAERALGHPEVDVVMLRFNAAQRGIFDLVEANQHSDRPKLIIGYTSTKWGYLVRRDPSCPSGMPIPTASDCYALTLESPGFDLVLAGPASRTELESSLDLFGYGQADWSRRRKVLLDYGELIATRYGRENSYESPAKFGLIPR